MKNIVLFRENIRTKIVTCFPNLGEWFILVLLHCTY